MSSVILTNWTVYYSGDTGGDLQVRWTGTTGTNTVRELYSELQDLFDNSTEMDDGTVMSAQTPTSYTIGLLDAGETNPWFIDPESIKHLTGGALQTQSWTRVTGTNIGIIKLPYTVGGGSDFISGDIGKHVDLGANDGTLLDYNSTDLECWIRPDTDTAADDFDDAGTLSVASGTGSVTIGATADTTGEMIWSNIFTLGTIETNTTLFVSQSNSVITNAEDSGSGSWWSDGHIDILILTTDQDVLIDRGLISVYARQYSKKYSFYSVDISAGGRTPIPLAASDDSNNETGYTLLNCSAGSGTFTVGEVIGNNNVKASATALGVVTDVSGTGADPDIAVYMIGDLTAFTNSDTVESYATSAQADVDTVSSAGPASQALSIAFGHDETLDVDEDLTDEHYSIVIDLTSSITLATMNERLKYITRRGETATLDGIEGQQYIGLDYRVDYTAGDLTGTVADGSTVTQTLADTTTATAEVVAHDTADYYLMLRDTRGTLEYGAGANNLEVDGSNYVVMSDVLTTTEIITPTNEHPFGIFAGGNFFGARGVAVKNVPSADSNNYELIDNGGNAIAPPSSISIVVTGVTQNTQCYVVDSVPTEYLNAEATTNVSGDEYQATIQDTYTIDISVTVRAREIGYLPFETSGTIVSSGLSVTAVWQVDPNFKFTVSGLSVTFNDADPDTIVRASGDFATDGWLGVMSQVTIEGSTSNDGTYEIASISTNTITLEGTETLTGGTDATGVTLTYTRRAPTW